MEYIGTGAPGNCQISDYTIALSVTQSYLVPALGRAFSWKSASCTLVPAVT